jgi:hypothetical protein
MKRKGIEEILNLGMVEDMGLDSTLTLGEQALNLDI